MKKLILLAALASLCGCASAESWTLINRARAPSGIPGEWNTLEVDTSSIQMRDGYRQGWWRRSFFPVIRDPINKEIDMGSVASLGIFDCRNETQGVLSYGYFPRAYGEGSTTRSGNLERAKELKDMSPNMPGTFGEVVLRYVCAYPLK